ncbi:MAG: hypothetical protein CM1200mP1_16690 [Candidatus Neomarinimicrobiota bacterium]|nr:MAG: hypothetical protein CM1200mP1_16690 [Candidatus Neomarinimicrobiota bacterium]
MISKENRVQKYVSIRGHCDNDNFIRGFGTTIIIDHGGGFYTVYSHVTNVEPMRIVKLGAEMLLLIWEIQDRLMALNYILKFGGGGKKLNPEYWLTKDDFFRYTAISLE